jgi:hypothetical protein
VIVHAAWAAEVVRFADLQVSTELLDQTAIVRCSETALRLDQKCGVKGLQIET